jgi:hypothetical protein
MMTNRSYPSKSILVALILLALVFNGVCLASNPNTTLNTPVPGEEALIAENTADNEPRPGHTLDASRQLFQQGYADYSRGKYQQAAECMHQFLNATTPNVQDYEWAEFFFGISLKRLGYTHAAVDTLTNLVIRKPNPQIVRYVLELMERISRSVPYDRDLLIDRALCDQSYDFIDGPAANFIHYYQGEYDWEHGMFDWGNAHFAQIPEYTYYHNKYLFRRALREILDNRIDAAVSLLKLVIDRLEDGDPLKDDARKTLARLFYEKGRYSEADLLYTQIEMNIVEQSQNLLERAWAHYRMGNPERAMGLLYSFEAPSYANSFTPEFYILKSFIYKDVCHYKTAMGVLEQFNIRYGGALEDIYHRQPLYQNKAILLVLLNKPKINATWKFLELLESESILLRENPDPNLKTYLEKLYDLKRKEVELQFKSLVNEAYERMANAMLQFEEEAHLMEYEIGIDMFQRVHSYHYEEGQASTDGTPSHKDKAIYAFQGEFWNDELDDYEVVLPNKCQNAEEWDIFFK